MGKIVRRGIVSAVNPQLHKVRVAFEDNQGLVSQELPVLTTYAGNNKLYHLPDVGEMVYCLQEENDSQTGAGVVIGSIFTEQATPNSDSLDKCKLDFGDGSFIEYDRSTSTLNIICVGEVNIKGSKINLN